MARSRTIDLRSDFLAHPTERMLDAYRAAATRGSYGLREDPLQRELEAAIAALLGCEDALIFPTCTMANQTAILLHTRPGDTVLCQESAHVLTSEAGAPAALAGVTLRTVAGTAVEAPIEAWLELARQVDGPAESNPSLCCVENTHNRLGGAVASAVYCAALAARLREKGRVKLHLDGARVLYAAAASGSTPAQLAAPFDTVSISLNKGLGSPIAAALAGTRETIARAEHIRQRLGGGIRPVAAGAAAALVALKDFTHLGEDIRRAKRFAALLETCEHLDFSAWPVASNLAFFSVTKSSLSGAELVKRCAAEGLLINASSNRLRAVFYRGISDDDVESAVAIIERVLDRRRDCVGCMSSEREEE